MRLGDCSWCVCVCVREESREKQREAEKDSEIKIDIQRQGVFTLVTASCCFDVDCSFFDVNVKL